MEITLAVNYSNSIEVRKERKSCKRKRIGIIKELKQSENCFYGTSGLANPNPQIVDL